MDHPLVKLAKEKYYNKKKSKISDFINKPTDSDNSKRIQKKANALIKNIEEYPHAFVLACLMDSGVDADVAWSIPYKVYEKLGTFEINDLYNVTLEEYKKMFNNEDKKWHRFPNQKAKYFYYAVHKIVENKFMNGDVSKIWAGKPTSKQVVTRFLDFKGCGLKIATMASNILYRDFGIDFSDLSSIDISADTHVTRVFQRLGLIPTTEDKKEIISNTIYKARELNPEFPGILDLLCWDVGRKYCHPENPDCKNCTINKYCAKKIETSKSVWE